MAIYKGSNEIKHVYYCGTEYSFIHLGGLTIFSPPMEVTCNFDNVTSNAPSSVAYGEPLSVTLTATNDKQIVPSTVTVTMGDNNITSTVYDGVNTITIACVTGDVTITAKAVTWQQINLTAKCFYRGTTVGGSANKESNNYYDAIKVSCVEGDMFKVTGRAAGTTARIWIWLNASEKIISLGGYQTTLTDYVLTAPSNAKYFIMNAYNDSPRSCYKGVS